ncbi:MAG TPA: permease prefix domain 1-containing protein [Terriglobales bacterium]|nr:permease prefix domain 1-containing protein [Terriglobales bacterium]
MPDFEALVRQRLGSLELPRDCASEVVAELAAHLEDHYELLIAQGSGDSAALAQALAALGNSRTLRRAIVREKENDMFARHKIMGPGMLALLLSGFAQWLCYILIHRRATVIFVEDAAFTTELPWLLSLLAVGAMTAWSGRRIGSTPKQRLLAAAFPGSVTAGLYLIALVADLALVHNSLHLKALALGLLGWSVLPSAASMIGALPFVLGAQRTEPKPSAAATA